MLLSWFTLIIFWSCKRGGCRFNVQSGVWTYLKCIYFPALLRQSRWSNCVSKLGWWIFNIKFLAYSVVCGRYIDKTIYIYIVWSTSCGRFKVRLLHKFYIRIFHIFSPMNDTQDFIKRNFNLSNVLNTKLYRAISKNKIILQRKSWNYVH